MRGGEEQRNFDAQRDHFKLITAPQVTQPRTDHGKKNNLEVAKIGHVKEVSGSGRCEKVSNLIRGPQNSHQGRRLQGNGPLTEQDATQNSAKTT